MNSAIAFFNTARAYKRELIGDPDAGLSQEDVDAINAATVRRWTVPQSPQEPHTAPEAPRPLQRGLQRAPAFFEAVRGSFGSLQQGQVDGFNRLLGAMAEEGWPLAFTAYGIETAWHETNKQMQPVEEAYWKSDEWRRRNLSYYPWHGRGDVQLTWEKNYRRADAALGLGGLLISTPALALDPAVSAKILVLGMEQGWFTTKRLANYLPESGPATHRQFQLARYIVNGQDKASQMADEALRFQAALNAGGWA